MRHAPAPQPHGAHHEAPSVETLVRHAHDALATAHVPVSPAKVSRLCRQYVRTVAPHGVAFVPWLVAQIGSIGAPARETLSADLYKRIAYRDETGETAASNVDKARQAVNAR